MSSVNIDQLFEKMSHIKAGVIGDVMLDTYMWGHVERISPEAPVPVVRVTMALPVMLLPPPRLSFVDV